MDEGESLGDQRTCTVMHGIKRLDYSPMKAPSIEKRAAKASERSEKRKHGVRASRFRC